MVNAKQRANFHITSLADDETAEKSSPLDSLCCEADEQSETITTENMSLIYPSQDSFCDDEEFQSLFDKEKLTFYTTPDNFCSSSLSHARTEAVQWILNINSHYGFKALTAILSVYYLDLFLSNSCFHQKDKSWMVQLASVACLSLASKVEETHVPLLIDLQVDGLRGHTFEAKTIQRMELLVLSSLEWRMNIVTPLSYIDHFVRRLEFKSLDSKILMRCEDTLLSCISDSRTMRYLPSVLAIATVLHVIHEAESINAHIDCKNQLLGLHQMNKEEIVDCYGLVEEILANTGKRKVCRVQSSPSTVGATFNSSVTSSDSSNERSFKKVRVHERKMKLSSSISKQI